MATVWPRFDHSWPRSAVVWPKVGLGGLRPGHNLACVGFGRTRVGYGLAAAGCGLGTVWLQMIWSCWIGCGFAVFASACHDPFWFGVVAFIVINRFLYF